ncbi:transcription factor SOX-9-like [Dendronephthya gigantea]|uniref:transcription factor SOX-9-like n=1 Tax=Dendronephthya gigantea TaxID=151771 RepID=UPI00106C3CB8|nr:transcription factor SOX-9-like [Dendronephthya gigantea]
MGSKAVNFEKTIKQETHFERNDSAKADQQDQSELGLAIAKAVTQVLESSDWRALSFPLQANSAKHSKAKNAVKRPMNPFMLYAQAARKKLSNLYPDLSYAKLSKTLGRIWKSLDQNEKQPFIDEAERLRQKHKIDHPDYKFQPKRRERKRTHSPSREAFENNKISTGDVLKVLSSTGNAKHHESQNLWAQTIHNGITSRGSAVQHNGGPQQQANGAVSSTPPYSGKVSPGQRIPKMTSNIPYDHNPQNPITTTNDLSSFSSRYMSMTPPPPLQRATTASLFSPSTAYRIPKSQAQNQPASYPHMSEIHSYPPSTAIQNYPSDLSLAIGNSFLKCSSPLARCPPHLTPNEEHQSTNLLTGVNQILRDMFGNDKNNVM